MTGGRDPRLFDPRLVAAMQSDVPSQQLDAGTPYYPSENIEIFQTTPEALEASAIAALQEARDNPAGDISSFTRYTYDSRPPLAYDFGAPLNDGTQTSITLYNGAYTVPDGFVGIVRGFHFTTRSDFFTMDQFGGFDTSAQITLFRNGVPIPGVTNMNVGQWGNATVEIETFILLNGGDTITGQWNNGLVLFQFGGGFNFYGQLLQDDGRDLPQQSGNMRPEPVVMVDASAVGAGTPPGGTAPHGALTSGAAAGGPGETRAIASQSQYFVYDSPAYPGPFPPQIGVNTYSALREQHHARVRQDYLAFVAGHPGATIDVKGDSAWALVPYNGV